MKVTGVTKTTVTVSWVWKRKSRPVGVNEYQVMLRRGSEMQSRLESVLEEICQSK